MDDKLKITKVNKVLSLKVVLDDPDARCKTGEHIQKIYPNRINMTNSDASFRPSGANKNKTITSVVEIPGSVDIATSSGEYQCNGIPRMGKVSGLNVHAYNRHGLESGEWTLVNEKSNGKDTNGTITGGSVSPSTYTLTGKADRDVICDTIYYKIVISGECGEGKIIEMKTSSGKPIASLKGNAKCLPG
jgi:hypothetical protein